MRTMIRIRIPVEAGNRAVKDGTMLETISGALERLKPEAAYFLPDQGVRTALLVVYVQDPAEVPVLVEPFFSKLDAAVELLPVMNAEDLKLGLAQIMR
jgi:hypothetical protein